MQRGVELSICLRDGKPEERYRTIIRNTLFRVLQISQNGKLASQKKVF